MTLVPEDTTPLDPEELASLKLSYISTRAELNAAEAVNIEVGLRWAGGGRSLHELLDAAFLCELHRRMFGDVWKWAGEYRKTDKNIGIPWWKITTQVVELLLDAAVWTGGASLAWPVDEIGVRFHHRLVSIHPFPNGNGRHSRAAADLLLVALDAEPFTWGRENLANAGEVRSRYITALHAADENDIGLLLRFVRS
ncbi:MAG TPA: mobile mystery protein B [Acidimicrobiales bacterium]|nr:mobile mystery protein B [Acidimicrobiales bacterium]